jgi:outer membrane autotransporter protein
MGGTPPFASGFPGGPGATGTINCQSDLRQDYAGFQLGQDLARLNLSGSGATLHAGVTGGYAESSAQDLAGSAFNGGFQVPFAGVYAVYANGNFFADALLRGDFYQMNLNAAPAALGNQKLDGVGLTEIISAGYKIDLGNSWFIQPSFSGIHSSTKIDTLNLPGGFGNFFNPLYLPPASVQFGTVESWLGRIGAQVGTSFTAGAFGTSLPATSPQTTQRPSSTLAPLRPTPCFRVLWPMPVFIPTAAAMRLRAP